jgi:endoglucanase
VRNVRVTRTRPVAIACAFLLLAIVSFQQGMPRAAAATSQGFVRVNQVGYATDATKRAYLMTSVDASSATFTVLGDSTSFSGPVGPDLGKWSKTFTHIYVLDFNDVTAPGSYTITVSGPVDATSPTFMINGGSTVYGDAISNSLSFYENERDGQQYLASDLRTAPAHLHDAHAMTYLTPNANSSGRFSGDLSALGKRIDASGGWWDAGDYLKFVQTTSYTVDMLGLGVRDFPNQMGAGSTTADFTRETKFGLRWLLHMWNDRTSTLYYQVGIGTGNAKTVGDHDIWRLPQDDDTYGGTDPRYRYIRHRPVFRAAAPGSPISPNLAGRLAAAFGVCYQIFHGTDPTFASRCLQSGEHIYDLADTSPSGDLLTVIPFSFYPENEWQSDMELGATELSLALAAGGASASLPHTDPRFYLRDGAHWAHAYISGPFDATDTLNLYDVSGIAHYELHGAIDALGATANLEVTPKALVDDIGKALDAALAQGATDPFGFGFPWASWDTTTHGAGLAVMASEYDELTGASTYAAYGDRWLANILGANAWGTSLIVGDGTTFPHCMQHQVTNIVGSLDGSPPILAGAAVEGPNGTLYSGSLTNMRPCPPDGSDPFAAFNGGGAKFRDNVESFSTVEPAIDLTATSPLAFARQIAGIR